MGVYVFVYGSLPAPFSPSPSLTKTKPIHTQQKKLQDNPASDIAGANAADRHCCEWVSILVRTGVFQDDPGHHPAKHVVDDVKVGGLLGCVLCGHA